MPTNKTGATNNAPRVGALSEPDPITPTTESVSNSSVTENAKFLGTHHTQVVQSEEKTDHLEQSPAYKREKRVKVAQVFRDATIERIKKHSKPFTPSGTRVIKSPTHMTTSWQQNLDKLVAEVEVSLADHLSGEKELTESDCFAINKDLDEKLEKLAGDKLAKHLVKAVRNNRKIQAETRVKDGTSWSADSKLEGINKRAWQNLRTLEEMVIFPSSVNTWDLMTPDEKELFGQISKTNFYLTHSTQQDLTKKVNDKGDSIKGDTMVLRSREDLVKKKILPSVAQDNTASADIERFKTDDFTFFSIEAGDHLQKANSRFGGRIYRIPAAEIGHIEGLMLTHDLIHSPSFAQSKRELLDLPGINDIADTPIETFNPDGSVDSGPTSSVYPTKALSRALACLAITRVRNLNAEQQQHIFALGKSSDGINSIVNGFLRPQILLPKVFFTSNFEEIDLSVVRSASELHKELNKLDPADGDYDEKLGRVYLEVMNRIPSTTEILPLDPSEGPLLSSLEKHMGKVGERNIAKLYVNHINRILYTEGSAIAKSRMSALLRSSSLSEGLKKNIADLFV